VELHSKLVAKLSEVYKDYEIWLESEVGIDYIVIVNPFGGENIRISDEDGIIFFFSYHHAHFDYGVDIDDNIDCLVDYINSFLYERHVAIEFFHGDTNLFGGSRSLDDIDASSGETLLKSFTGDNFSSLQKHFYEQLRGINCHCSIRGWDIAYNKDIDFIL